MRSYDCVGLWRFPSQLKPQFFFGFSGIKPSLNSNRRFHPAMERPAGTENLNKFARVKQLYTTGDKITFKRMVRMEDTAAFESGAVHSVYATFALARDAEWCSRQFVLQMKETQEEGIGTFVNVTHLGPALVGEEVIFEATIDELNGNNVNCSFTAKVGNRLVAQGRTGQKILLKTKIEQLFARLTL